MIDILFLAKDRYQFTAASLLTLFKNTSWELVRSVWLYEIGRAHV